jgi:hypothetical protein
VRLNKKSNAVEEITSQLRSDLLLVVKKMKLCEDDEAAPAVALSAEQGGKREPHDVDEDDRKPAAVASTTPAEEASGAPATSPTTTMLLLQRSSYADAFLARCDKVDPDDFDLPNGTYICPWMPAEPVEQVYYGCGNSSFGEVRRDTTEAKRGDMSYWALLNIVVLLLL